LCHTIQHRAVLITFPLNLQTLTITYMLSSGGEGETTPNDATCPHNPLGSIDRDPARFYRDNSLGAELRRQCKLIQFSSPKCTKQTRHKRCFNSLLVSCREGPRSRIVINQPLSDPAGR